MTVEEKIRQRLTAGLACQHLEVDNESGQHNVPPGSESHFRVVIVAPEFSGKAMLARHRLVYGLLEEEMASHVHALALHTYTEDEWRQRYAQAPLSPPCQGGGKVEAADIGRETQN